MPRFLICKHFENARSKKCTTPYMEFQQITLNSPRLLRSWHIVSLMEKLIKSLYLKLASTMICLTSWKIRRNVFSSYLYRLRDTVHELLIVKRIKNIPKQTLALIWLYLQIIGKPVESLMNETNVWTFNRRDFKNSITYLILNDEQETDETSIKMRELISNHFQTDKELTDWSKEIFKQVRLKCCNATWWWWIYILHILYEL